MKVLLTGGLGYIGSHTAVELVKSGFEVEIMEDPYTFLMNSYDSVDIINKQKRDFDRANSICLRLYSENHQKGKFVAEKSGLNQWNAGGRKRHPNEI